MAVCLHPSGNTMHSAQSTPDTKPDVPGCQTGSITVASCWCYSLLVHGLRSIVLLWGILLLLSISLLLISLLRDTLCGVLLLRVPCSCRRCGQVNQNSDRCRTTDRFEYTTYLEEDNLTCCPDMFSLAECHREATVSSFWCLVFRYQRKSSACVLLITSAIGQGADYVSRG